MKYPPQHPTQPTHSRMPVPMPVRMLIPGPMPVLVLASPYVAVPVTASLSVLMCVFVLVRRWGGVFGHDIASLAHFIPFSKDM
ncbi:hypothetical protein SAMN05421869_112152 [Nonomuraea jiangxiensis]|uniref:Uncharacterized protein n=1 Tax=Nonomuraea jiangxiensis TaxID=633440 RepID=A0A1G8WFJ9_9ACTN|nr:hypothetical protein SAMN05421869_112152 [Nonomuraea jiangxiensis]